MDSSEAELNEQVQLLTKLNDLITQNQSQDFQLNGDLDEIIDQQDQEEDDDLVYDFSSDDEYQIVYADPNDHPLEAEDQPEFLAQNEVDHVYDQQLEMENNARSEDVATKKPKKKSKQKNLNSDLMQKAHSLLIKQNQKSQNIIKKVAKKQSIIKEETEPSDEEPVVPVLKKLNNAHKQLYSDVMDIDYKYRPNTAVADSPEKKDKEQQVQAPRGRQKNNNQNSTKSSSVTRIIGQIYRKQANKVSNADLIDLGFFDEDVPSPRKDKAKSKEVYARLTQNKPLRKSTLQQPIKTNKTFHQQPVKEHKKLDKSFEKFKTPCVYKSEQGRSSFPRSTCISIQNTQNPFISNKNRMRPKQYRVDISSPTSDDCGGDKFFDEPHNINEAKSAILPVEEAMTPSSVAEEEMNIDNQVALLIPDQEFQTAKFADELKTKKMIPEEKSSPITPATVEAAENVQERQETVIQMNADIENCENMTEKEESKENQKEDPEEDKEENPEEVQKEETKVVQEENQPQMAEEKQQQEEIVEEKSDPTKNNVEEEQDVKEDMQDLKEQIMEIKDKKFEVKEVQQAPENLSPEEPAEVPVAKVLVTKKEVKAIEPEDPDKTPKKKISEKMKKSEVNKKSFIDKNKKQSVTPVKAPEKKPQKSSNKREQSRMLNTKSVAMANSAAVKRKIDNGQKIMCQILSVEPFIRRAVSKIGWQDAGSNSNFHVKFDVSDTSATKKPGQYYNHFPDNRQLTTKAGLCKNLWSNCAYESSLGTSHFFPRCYDISDEKQAQHFVEDFETTAILSLLKQMAMKFMENEKTVQLVQYYENKNKYACPNVFKHKFMMMCRDDSDHHYEQIKQLIFYAKTLLKDETKKSKKQFAKLSEESVQKLIELHESKGYLEYKCIQMTDQVKIIRLHQKLLQRMPQYQKIDGNRNLWVVKPSFNSRGVGIYLSNTLKDIIQVGKKSQTKVVQKYIETPYLLNNRKFDVRQWVLVTNWEPLEAFVFDSAYLKFCSKDFTLDDNDIYRHLSNYSIQGEERKSSLEFETLIGKPGVWNETILPRIDKVIFNTLKCIQDSQITENSQCFEIYGFDLVLDERMEPWVIEVNLSPACSEKEPWLTKMLDDMAMGLMNWLQRKILVSSSSENFTEELKRKRDKYIRERVSNEALMTLNNEDFFKKYGIKHKWIKLEGSADEQEQFNLADFTLNANQQLNLELVGSKLDIKLEKKIDLNQRKKEAVADIQRIYRGHLGRKSAIARKELLATIVFQKYARRKLAIKLRKFLYLQKQCKLVQCQIRRVLAQKLKQKMYEERRQNARIFVAVKLQSNFKRKKAQQLLKELRETHSAKLIQKFMRGYRNWVMSKYKMYYKTMVIRLQLHFKRRFRNKQMAIKIVQRQVKTYKIWNKYQKLNRISKGFKIVRKTIELRKKFYGIRGFNQNKSAVTVQKFMKGYSKYKFKKNLQKSIAQLQIRFLLQSHFNKFELKRTLNMVRFRLHRKARTIQGYMKNYVYRQRIKALKIAYLYHTSAVKIQKVIKGNLCRQKLRQFLINRDIAVVVIQKNFRMFPHLWRFRQHYQSILKIRQEKEDNIKNLKNYMQKLKNEEKQTPMSPTDRLEEIQSMVQQKQVTNQVKHKKATPQNTSPLTRTNAFQKYFERKQKSYLPTNGKKSRKQVETIYTKAEQKIKDLENQFYDKVSSAQQVQNLPQSLPEVTVQKRRAYKPPAAVKKNKSSMVTSVTYQRDVNPDFNVKKTFAENLKNLLQKTPNTKSQTGQTESSTNVAALKSSQSTAKIMENTIKIDLGQRPIYDPKSEALNNLERTSASQKSTRSLAKRITESRRSESKMSAIEDPQIMLTQQSNNIHHFYPDEEPLEPESDVSVNISHEGMVRNALLDNMMARKNTNTNRYVRGKAQNQYNSNNSNNSRSDNYSSVISKSKDYKPILQQGHQSSKKIQKETVAPPTGYDKILLDIYREKRMVPGSVAQNSRQDKQFQKQVQNSQLKQQISQIMAKPSSDKMKKKKQQHIDNNLIIL